MTPDLINGAIEFAGFMFALANVRRLYRDRTIKGVYWPATAFWTAWGYWNLFYYPALGQWFSAGAGALLALANTWWVVLAAVYAWRARKRRRWELPVATGMRLDMLALEIGIRRNVESDDALRARCLRALGGVPRCKCGETRMLVKKFGVYRCPVCA